MGSWGIRAGAFAAIAAAAFALGEVPRARATFPGPVSKIAYEDRDGNIVLANPDGSGKSVLTTGGSNSDVSFSADGKQIVFVTYRDADSDGRGEIYTMNVDGTDQKRLTNNTVADSGAAFSPDGRRIVFVSERDSPNGQVYTMDADGSNVALVSASPNSSDPSFSPDGRRIIFATANEIRLVDVDGSNETVIVSDQGRVDHASFSPDGSRIVMNGFGDDLAGELYTANSDGSGFARVGDGPVRSASVVLTRRDADRLRQGPARRQPGDRHDRRRRLAPDDGDRRRADRLRGGLELGAADT
jgi:Tol biopolymer transport system component